MPRTGRRVALLCTLAGFGVIAACAVAFRESLRESWYILRLRSSDDSVQAGAARELVEVRSTRALPHILKAFPGDAAMAETIRDVFDPEELQGTAPESVPVLVVALGHEEEATRHWAAEFLQVFGREARPAVPSLIDALRDGSKRVQLAAITALAAVGPDAGEAVPALLKLIKTSPSQGTLRVTADLALDVVGEGNLAAFIQVLEDEEEPAEVKSCAAAYLGFLGPRSRAAVPALVALLDDDSEQLRWDVAVALGGIGEEAAGAVPALTRELESRSLEFRREIVITLGRIGPAAEAAVPRLAVLLEGSPDRELRRLAAATLGWIGSRAEDAVPVLIAALRDESTDVRESAAVALGKIGPRASPAVPALTKALRDESRGVRYGAAMSLRGLGTAAVAALGALTEALRDPSPVVRMQVAITFERIGQEIGQAGDLDARRATAALCEAVRGEDAVIGYWAARALAAIGEEGRATLLEAAREDPVVRERARQALRELDVEEHTRSTNSD